MTANPAASPSLSIVVKENPDEIVVYCAGALVAENAGQLKETVRPLLARAKHVRIDLEHVPYVDSSGLGTIVSLYTSSRAAGSDLKLVHFNDHIRNLLHITNLRWLLE